MIFQFLSCFGLKKSLDFDRFGLKQGTVFYSRLALGSLLTVTYLQPCSYAHANGNHFMVSFDHKLESCSNFRSLKWGIDIWCKSDEQSQILV